MLTRRILIAASMAGSMLAAGSAFAQGQPVVGISTVTTYSADARITAVDPNARTVSLAFTNGATAVRQVSPSVANFAQTKVGDMVSLAFEDRLTFVLSGPNTRTPGDRDTSVTVATGGGGSVAGASAGQAVANWWVTGVNPSAGTISLINPGGGEVRTYNVTTPEGRAQLPRVKPGDSVTAINSSVAVIAITPKS
ncbi:hypothetical protein SAMN02990966_04455 [Rhodospirillales bacterium URHD0017]|nr:hypothetical protein SAMN02990966_04455 [Rhodospirillales bacterium URHD0017]